MQAHDSADLNFPLMSLRRGTEIAFPLATPSAATPSPKSFANPVPPASSNRVNSGDILLLQTAKNFIN